MGQRAGENFKLTHYQIERELDACDAYDFKSEAFVYANHFGASNLIPADEVQARIDSAVSEAVREERERAARVAETHQVQADVPHTPSWQQGYMRAQRAIAAAIRGHD